jgi:hypothetical protein
VLLFGAAALTALVLLALALAASRRSTSVTRPAP